jgi:hypothetical protein
MQSVAVRAGLMTQSELPRAPAGRMAKTYERIEKPADRPTRYRYPFAETTYWVGGAIFIGLSMLGFGLHYNSVKEANTVEDRFGEIQLLDLPWYYDSPVLGAIVIGGISSLIAVALFINILKAAHYAAQNEKAIFDLSSQLHHTAWSLQGQIEDVKAGSTSHEVS